MAYNLVEYSAQVLEHYEHPRNVGEIEDADGVATAGNPACGDLMKLSLRIRGGVIEDARFKTFGCGAAIAASSMTTEMLKGRSLEEAAKLTNRDVAAALGGLPPVKMHCSVLAEDAVRAALADYRNRTEGGAGSAPGQVRARSGAGRSGSQEPKR